MRSVLFLLGISIGSVICKSNVKSLTESLGQEVIEIAAPIKDLPPGIEEEPSAEYEDKTTVHTTKRETRKTSTTFAPYTKKKIETVSKEDKISKDESLSKEDEESRIEKELADIYKDTDYKVESTKELLEMSTIVTVNEEDKPIARAKSGFKFQPDVNNRAEVERFRTSVDEISCNKRVTQQLSKDIDSSSALNLLSTKVFAMEIAFLSSIIFV